MSECSEGVGGGGAEDFLFIITYTKIAKNVVLKRNNK